jgi:hypothetical protein
MLGSYRHLPVFVIRFCFHFIFLLSACRLVTAAGRGMPFLHRYAPILSTKAPLDSAKTKTFSISALSTKQKKKRPPAAW